MRKYVQADSPYSIYDILYGFGYIVVRNRTKEELISSLSNLILIRQVLP